MEPASRRLSYFAVEEQPESLQLRKQAIRNHGKQGNV
jgi:hypothetical protein